MYLSISVSIISPSGVLRNRRSALSGGGMKKSVGGDGEKAAAMAT